MPAPILKPFRTPPALKRAQRGMHVTPRPNPSASHSDPFFRDLHLRLRLASFLGPSWPPSTTPNLHLALTRTPLQKKKTNTSGIIAHNTRKRRTHRSSRHTRPRRVCTSASPNFFSSRNSPPKATTVRIAKRHSSRCTRTEGQLPQGTRGEPERRCRSPAPNT